LTDYKVTESRLTQSGGRHSCDTRYWISIPRLTEYKKDAVTAASCETKELGKTASLLAHFFRVLRLMYGRAREQLWNKEVYSVGLETPGLHEPTRWCEREEE
jgi:hypothetical protein